MDIGWSVWLNPPDGLCAQGLYSTHMALDDDRRHVYGIYTQGRCIVRTNVVLDDKLMSRALRSSGCRTKRATIESGLRLLVQVNSQRKLRSLKGKIAWEGDLEDMRRD